MRTSGPPTRVTVRRALQQRIVWPLLDLLDFLLGRKRQKKPLYPMRRVPRRQRLKSTVVDEIDSVVAPFRARHRHRQHEHHGGTGLKRVAQVAGVFVVLLAGLTVLLGGDNGGGGTGGTPDAGTGAPAAN